MTSTATHSSLTSLYIGSLANCSSRSRTSGFEPLIAIRTRDWLTIHCTAAPTATNDIQASAWPAGFAAAPGTRWMRPRKTRAAVT